MDLLYEPQDPHLLETLEHLARFALEAPNSNMRVQVGSVALSCTANVTQTQAVTFNRPFKKGGTVYLFPFANPATAASLVKPSFAGLTETGFTAQVNTDTTQTVQYEFLAIGPV